jgi:regulator of cell morphogenesis and NO signaling
MLIRTPTVAVLALEHPACVGVFLKHRIDFCCAGDVTVAEACAARGLDANAVQAELDAVIRDSAGAPIADPRAVPTEALISHIVARHHGYLRRTLPTVLALATKVARVHGQREPKLRSLAVAVQELMETLEPHLDHEEKALFPVLASGQADAATTVGELADMTSDHRAVAQLLERIQDASDGFRVPPWGCNSYRALFSELKTMDADIREHVHLENHVLAPRFAPDRAAATP